MNHHWQEDKRQKAWLWVGGLFMVFYFAEALLFWGPNPRVAAPSGTPLVFWGLFGVALTWAVSRRVPGVGRAPLLERLQTIMLGTSITASVIGSAYLVIWRTGDITLGHIILLLVLGQAGLVIGAMSFNIGWLLAGVFLIAGAVWILCRPAGQDYVLGAIVGSAFLLIGLYRKHIVRASPERL